MMQQTIQQQRAKYALERVQQAISNNLDHKEYKSYAASFPAMIHTNGLGQAAAFFRSKGVNSPAHQALYDLLSDWLCGKCEYAPNQTYRDCENMLDGIFDKDMHDYRLAQAEAQALMDWVKKFAKAFMNDGDEEGDRE